MAVPAMLKPLKPHGNTRRKMLAAVLVVLTAALAVWLARWATNATSGKTTAGRAVAPERSASSDTIFKKRSAALQEAMKNGIISPTRPNTDAPNEPDK